jgi:tetratricopeptide (TPR) repeat protein
LGMAAVRLANLHIRIGNGEAAQEMLTHTRATLPSDAMEESAFYWSALSDLHIHHGQYEAAYQEAQEAQRLFQQVGNRGGTARANVLLGMTSYRLGRVEQAREYLQEAVEMARQTGEPRLRLTAIDTLADVLCHFGEYETAQRYFEEALETSRTLGDLYYSALILNNLGTVHFTQQRFDQASSCYQECLELCQRVGDRVGEAIALSNLAEIASLEGKHEHAWQLCEQSLDIGRELDDTWTVLAAFCGLSEAAFAQGDYPRARDCALQGLHMAVSSQTMQMQARLAVELGGALWKLGQAETAREVLNAASRDQACADDVRQRAQTWLAELGGTLPDEVPALNVLAAGLLAAELG